MACHWHIKVVKEIGILKFMRAVAKDLAIKGQEVEAPQELANGHESAAFHRNVSIESGMMV